MMRPAASEAAPGAASATPATDAVARIGPNAILRIAEALRASRWAGDSDGETLCRRVFARAALEHRLRVPPEDMVPQREVQRLHAALRAELGPARSAAVSAQAGRRTAAYLLAHRIPQPVQRLLKLLPAGWAARLLLRAIRRHAWTFAGSGEFSARAGHPMVLTLRHNPLCEGLRSEAPACSYYAATFEALFQALVHPQARVQETACEAMGANACRFELSWTRRPGVAPPDRTVA